MFQYLKTIPGGTIHLFAEFIKLNTSLFLALELLLHQKVGRIGILRCFGPCPVEMRVSVVHSGRVIVFVQESIYSALVIILRDGKIAIFVEVFHIFGHFLEFVPVPHQFLDLFFILNFLNRL